MASYNTSGVTSYDPRNLGGSEGYGPSKPASKGLASKPKASKMDSDMYAGSNYAPTSGAGTSKAKQTYAYNAAATANDDNVSYGQSYSPMALSAAFTSAGATLPPPAASKTMTFRDYTGGSLYDSDIFKPNILPDNSSDINNFLGRAAIDDALREALGPPESPEIYLGQQTPSEPDPSVDMSVLQGALQPEPITVEEIEVKAGDTLTAIAKDNDVSLSDLIDVNPQIGNPDLIRPGEKVALPDPRFEGVPKPRGVADSPRLSEGVADPRKIGGGIDGIEAPVAEVADMGGDPRNLGGAEGYGSVGTPPEADTGEGLMSKPLTDDDMGLPDSKVPAPDLAFINSAGTKQGVNERSVYEYAYEQGLEGDELKAFMSQVAHESRTFSKLEEGGYTRANVNSVSTSRYKVGDTYKGEPLTADDPMVGKFKKINRRRFVRDGVTDPNGTLQNYSAENVHNSMYANRMGNGDFASGDGSRYKGRGYIQLTGRDNYRLIGEDIGEDLENNPDLMLDPKIAEKASVAWWKRNVQTEQPDYTDVEAVTRIVNGGVNGLTDRRKKFNRYNETVTTPTRTPRPQARN